MSRDSFVYAGTPERFVARVQDCATEGKLHGCSVQADSPTTLLLFVSDPQEPSSALPRPSACRVSATPHPSGARVRVQALFGTWVLLEQCWFDLWDTLAATGDIVAEVMTLPELEESVLSKYERESVAWWRALAAWYWAGGREHFKSQDSLAEELGLPSVDTLHRKFRDYKPSAGN